MYSLLINTKLFSPGSIFPQSLSLIEILWNIPLKWTLKPEVFPKRNSLFFFLSFFCKCHFCRAIHVTALSGLFHNRPNPEQSFILPLNIYHPMIIFNSSLRTIRVIGNSFCVSILFLFLCVHFEYQLCAKHFYLFYSSPLNPQQPKP